MPPKKTVTTTAEKKTKAPAAKKTTTTTNKKVVSKATAKKVSVSTPSPQVILEDDDDDGDAEAGAGMSNEDRQKRNSRKKNVEETYVKKSQRDHIYDLPDTYIGSIEMTQLDTWVLDENDEKMIYKTLQYIPGLYKIFDEVLVNAIDQYVRTENDETITNKVTQIKVNIDVENNMISVLNTGDGIPVVQHAEHGVYIPEMIFGHLLTSSNYNKYEKKVTGGKNGLGSKVSNILSTSFKVETVDLERKLKYIQ